MNSEERSDETTFTAEELDDAIDYGDESWFFPLPDGGERGSVVDVLRDLRATRARLAAAERERDEARSQVISAHARGDSEAERAWLDALIVSERASLAASPTPTVPEPTTAVKALGYLLLCHDTPSARASDWLMAWKTAAEAMHAATGYVCPGSPTPIGPEPARCEHKRTEAHARDDSDQSRMRWCPGPATPEPTDETP